MKSIYFFKLLISLFPCCIPFLLQQKELSADDKNALENIIVEEYYVAGDKDYEEKVGGILPKGSITYRIYVDLKPGYSLQAVYGSEKHPLNIETSTHFFNNTSYGTMKGDFIDDKKINENSVALDSWLTIGAATQRHNGTLKSDDNDGSIIERPAFKLADGLIAGKIVPIISIGIDLDSFYGEKQVNSLISTNGSWAAYGGVKGPTEGNRILIAQLTTDGKLSYELNIQVGTPSGYFVRYVANNSEGEEIKFDGLVKKR